MISSTPSFTEYDPYQIPFQGEIVEDIDNNIDWSLGVHEFLLSGSIGSGKSLVAAHLGIKSCLEFPHSRGVIARKALPDVRATIYTKLVEHLQGAKLENGEPIEEGRHYFLKETTCEIKFFNGSHILARSWSDKKYKKLGSLELSWAIVEELTENDEEDEMAIKYLRMRVGRLPHIRKNWIMYLTNPDGPSHFAYEYFDIGKRFAKNFTGLPLTRHVYFSRTEDNKFLPKTYIDQLKENLDERLARRMLYGEWVELTKDQIYYSYGEHNFKNEEYEIRPELPIAICHDFNIGQGKPMSACLAQYHPESDTFHFFDEVIVDGADTEAIMDEMASRELLDFNVPEYLIFGDATGESKSANSKKSNYDIIIGFLSHHRTNSGRHIYFSKQVPKSNPPIRERHNIVNAYCKNAFGKTRLYVYKKCQTLHKGMRLTELKSGGQYIEDDSKPYQHVTTALGYYVHRVSKMRQNTGNRVGYKQIL